MNLLNAQVAHLPVSVLIKPIVAALHEHKYWVHGANLNEPEEIISAIRLGIDQFSTDNVELALLLRHRENEPNFYHQYFARLRRDTKAQRK